MATLPLQPIGTFELIRPLGSGGMGEVSLARDLTLGRLVALKCLPAQVTADPDRVSRFRQEARACSALNHPNVCTVYAFAETADGRHYIAMEYVEGETLRQRLGRGPLPLADSLGIAVQIAAALNAGHTAGVVHRDVKPENVMIRPDGVVKVLDFGLAKLEPSPGAASDSTETSLRTGPGTVLGTVQYMSPEQACGQPVDSRTDIWALGAILFEMVTGRSPFAAASTSEVIVGVLERSAPPLAAFDATAPPELQRIISKTLRKAPAQRYQTMEDLRLDLETLRDELRGIGSSPSAISRTDRAGHATAAVGLWSRLTRSPVVWAGVAIFIAIAAWLAVQGRQRTEAPSQAARHAPVRLTFGEGLQGDVTWSPDGRSIAYASDRAGNFDIWVQPVDGGEPRQLTRSPSPETEPSWSPDGSTIVFRSEAGGGGLFAVSANGGAERQLTSVGWHPEWASGGSEVFFRTGGQGAGYGGTGLNVSLYSVSPGGGEPPREVLQKFVRAGSWDWMASHPDGRISLLGLHSQHGSGFFTVTRDGQHVTQSAIASGLPLQLRPSSITGMGTRVVRFSWHPTGTALFVEAVVKEVRNIWRIGVDPQTLQWQTASQLTAGTGDEVGTAVSPDGSRLAFTTARVASKLWVFPIDASAGRLTGEGKPLTSEDGIVGQSLLTRDGARVAYSVRQPGGQNGDLWGIHIDTGQRKLLAQNVIRMAWSPDGNSIAYSLARPEDSQWAVAVRQIDGPERLLGPWTNNAAFLVSDWAPGGNALLGSYFAPLGSPARLALWPSSSPAAEPEKVLISAAPAGLFEGRFSPDGRWLAFVVSQQAAPDRLELMIAPAGGGPASGWTRVAADHAWPDKPHWAPDGRMLYFLSRHNGAFFNLWAVPFDPTHGRVAGTPFMVTRFDSPRQALSPNMSDTDMGISAARALLTIESVSGSIWMLNGVDK